MSIAKRLSKIQQVIKAPKNQWNKFGKYSYRNCEDIQEAVKPHLGELALYLTDEIVAVGDRIYVKATATITDGEHSIQNSAFAREEAQKEGMDAAQLTGSTSSYARKYALAGLLLLDDTRDADSQANNSQQEPAKPQLSALSNKQIEWASGLLNSGGTHGDIIKRISEKAVLTPEAIKQIKSLGV